MKIGIKIAFALLLFVLSASCGQNNSGTEESIIGLENIPPGEINTSLRITAPDSINTFRVGDAVALVVDNYSDQFLGINPRDDIRIFIDAGEEWIETENEVYDARPPFTVWPKSPDYPGAMFVVSPAITEQGSSVALRIVIVATVYQGDLPTSTITGGYIDVTLNP